MEKLIEFNNEVYDLEIAGLRKALHQDLDENFYEVFEGDQIDEELEAELEEAHELISAQDVNGLSSHMIGFDITFMAVNNSEYLEEALKEAGYQMEFSNVSRSLYVINDDGKEVRFADHKRPSAPTIGGNYVDHEYENEITVKDNKVTAQELSRYGIELEKGEYYLG